MDARFQLQAQSSVALFEREGSMYFYIDESGHTGANLFDDAQPMLYYGVLHSRVNIDALAEAALAVLRKELRVERLHAAELGNGRLPAIAPKIAQLRKKLDFRFDLYRVAKPDHAIICFFDQVFDQGMNPAVPWTSYWTPMRYMLLINVASLFNEEMARMAWEARTSPDEAVAFPLLREVCEKLRGRVSDLPDERSRAIITDSLLWAEQNTKEISYNVSNQKDVLQITPNVIGFQSVMHGIAGRLGASGRKAARIVVDQQSQFNKAQKTLADFYSSVRDIKPVFGPGMPEASFKHMPSVPIEFSSSRNSAGLELVDIHLWVFKRAMEGKELARELHDLIHPHLHKGRTDEISLRAIASRWEKWFEDLPQLEEMSPEQIERGRQMMADAEEKRLKAVASGIKQIAGSDSSKV
jgi:Protein of unknown function (DUF3800)